jgi:hypothetical protein
MRATAMPDMGISKSMKLDVAIRDRGLRKIAVDTRQEGIDAEQRATGGITAVNTVVALGCDGRYLDMELES